VRVLFVAYCFGGDRGQTLIGVYKRGLRVAMELCDRGHEVLFYCTGRDGYEDDLTRAAASRLRFVDIPYSEEGSEAAAEVRRRFRDEMARLEPDVVVIGEAPLAGALLEGTLCAVELGVPVVLLDNAYDRMGVYRFCMRHGAMFDGMVLTGTTCQHVRLPRPPDWLCQVAPYIESSTDGARRLIAGAGLTGERLVTILAYDHKVQEVGQALLRGLDAACEGAGEYLFLARQPEAGPELLAALPEPVRSRAAVVAIPADPVLFGVVQLSRLAIAKYGYMQVTECLALRTPVVAVFHEGNTWVDGLPMQCQRYVCVTSAADDRTVAEAARLLAVEPDDMAEIHDGRLGAAAATARFLEQLPRTPRSSTRDDTVQLGFREARLRGALTRELGTDDFRLRDLRAMFLRDVPDGALYSLACACEVGEEERLVRLWARQLATADAVERDAAGAAGSERRILSVSPADRLLIEADLGQQLLPVL